MKQKDIAIIGVAVLLSIIISIFVSKKVFTTQSTQQQAEIVQPISSDFPTPTNKYFNGSTYDPSSLITIGQNNNSNPFNSSTGSQ
jgi:hypothetical protein